MASKRITFQLSGLSCGSCVGRAEKALSAVAGVSGVAVNLANAQATFLVGNVTQVEDAVAALAEAGYPAELSEATFDISDMNCGSCVGRVERALRGVVGVVAASANLATETATVSFMSDVVTPTEIAAAAKTAGYQARPREQVAPSSDAKQDEARRLRQHLIIAAVLTTPVFVLEMGSHFVPGVHDLIHRTIGMQASWVMQFVLVTLVLLWPGQDFFVKGFRSLRKVAPDMNALVAVGTGAAWAFSTVATFLPWALPPGTRAVYFEAAAVIVTLILLGRYLEARAKQRTGDAIRKLVALQPKTATVIAEDGAKAVAIDQIAVGAHIRVHPGERIPLDGTVIAGDSFVDESMITGEAMPVAKLSGADVTGGTVNGAGSLTIVVNRTGEDTTLAQIIRMVADAQGAKLPIQSLVNQITLWFVPAVLVLALLTIFAWMLFGPDPALSYALVAGVAVLIVACPCAMGLATPTSIMVGTGRAAALGVLFRKGDALQALRGVGVVAFDKTGTLTMGQPALSHLAVMPGYDAGEVLRRAASLEALSEHPIAQAIVQAAQAEGLALKTVENFVSETGFGVTATVEGQDLRIGAARMMLRDGIDVAPFAADAETIALDGQTPLYVAVEGQLTALIGVSDPLKAEAATVIAALKQEGYEVAMITGDDAQTAHAIAARLGITHVRAEVLPSGKVAALDQLRQSGQKLAFVGDGINDAPALASADVGVAIGTGADIAVESADVVLMSGDLTGVLNAFDVSRRTMRNIKQNLFWAFAYNIALIPVAAGALYIFGGPLLSPMLAAGAMALSSVFVVMNALRLRTAGNPAKAASASAFVPREVPA